MCAHGGALKSRLWLRQAEKPEKGKRAKKDKDAPKKGLSAFMFFSNAKREEVGALSCF
jgi:hypothetical protein